MSAAVISYRREAVLQPKRCESRDDPKLHHAVESRGVTLLVCRVCGAFLGTREGK